MDSQMQRAKRPVSAALAGPYGHPLHPIAVTVPIGAWVCSLVFDVAAQIVDDPAFLARGSQWLIAIGVLGALAAACLGFLDLFGIPSGTPAHRTALVHMSLNLTVTVAYALNFWWRQAAGSGSTEVSGGQLMLSVLSLLALGVSGFLGGMLAYRYGVRVADEGTQAEGYRLDPGVDRPK
jgi:uncharacterized membrane protein